MILTCKYLAFETVIQNAPMADCNYCEEFCVKHLTEEGKEKYSKLIDCIKEAVKFPN